jgi:PTH1 family peptidyl-tRNA hydrolase
LKLIVGLGNPGKRYEETRHNIGFKVVSALAERYNIRLSRKAFSSIVGGGSVFGEEVTLALPQTYMNNSGEAVRALVSRKRAGIKDLLVVCDDVNLSLGIIRLRENGSAGGHNGLASIIEHLDSGDFARIRVGIGRDTQSPRLSGYVLSQFRKEEMQVLETAIDRAVDCCAAWIKDGTDRAASIFNQKNHIDRKD